MNDVRATMHCARHRGRTPFLAVMTMALLTAACGQKTTDMSQKIDELMAPYRGEVPGAAVLVMRDGDVVYNMAYGLADVEGRVPATTATNFRLASVSKQFTATAVMKLVERGVLGFDTRLTDLFPGFPEYGRTITVSHLLSHTSGLVDYENLIPDTATVQVSDADALDMMMALDSTCFEPGSGYRYSNTAYALLALAVERLSGRRYADFLREEIFEPLGMNETVAFEDRVSVVGSRAYGHVFDDSLETFVRRDQSITSAVLGDGGIYSSVDDLAKWEAALVSRTVLPGEMLDLAWTAKPNTAHEEGDPDGDGTGEEYGYGVYVNSYRGHRNLRHSGSTMGFRNDMERFPHIGLSVYVLTNRNSPAVIELARSIADLYLEK